MVVQRADQSADGTVFQKAVSRAGRWVGYSVVHLVGSKVSPKADWRADWKAARRAVLMAANSAVMKVHH